MLGQHRAQLGGAGLGERGAGGVLGPYGDHRCAGAPRQGCGQRGGQRALVVQPDGHGGHPEGGQQVEQAAPARVLDGDLVAGAQLGGEDALDGVQRAGADRECALGGAVRAEVGVRQREQPGIGGRVPVEHRVAVTGGGRDGQGGPERGQ